MANVSGASLGPIFSRLNGAPEYHPLEADTFADWSVEAGDIVTVTRDGNSYASPVHQASMSWKRGQQVQLSATGSKEREPLTKLSQQKFNRGGGGMRRQDYWHQYVTDMYGNIRSGIELTESHARLYAQNAENTMRSELKLTESSAHLYSENLYTQMKSGLKLTESSAHLYTESLYRQLRSGIELAADSASMYVNSKTTRAAICLAINGNGGSSTLIQSNHVQVTGGITVRDIMDITESGYVRFKRGVHVSNNAGGSGGCTLWPDGLFQGSSLMLASKGSSGYAVSTIDAEQLGKVFIDLKVSATKGTFTRLNGETVDFNRTVTLSGTWNDGKLVVSSSPKAQANYERWLGSGATSWADDYKSATIPIVAKWGSSQQYSESTDWSVYVNAYPAWENGYNTGRSESSYPYSKTMTCTSKNYSAGTWVYTFRYSINNSSLWNVDQNYIFHHNSGYT